VTNLPRMARMLLVDDNAMDVELALDAFNEVRLSNQIDVARSGQEALDRLFGRGPRADRGRHPLPDLILLDLKMPGIDGFEVLRQIKGTPVLRRIPVVILTSSREEGDRAMSYDTGANSYVVKPLSFVGLLEVVKKIHDYWLALNVGPPLPDIDVVKPA
jgi:CheY-like chemotaxis protein